MKFAKTRAGSYGISYLAAGLFMFALVYFFEWVGNLENDPARVTRTFQEEYSKQERLASELLRKISEDLRTHADTIRPDLERISGAREAGLAVYLYQHDSLRFWSDNTVPVPSKPFPGVSGPLVHLKNGWYRMFRMDRDTISLRGYLLIRHEFPFHNEYLQDRFAAEFRVASAIRLSEKPGRYNIHNADGTFFCSLTFPGSEDSARWPALILGIFLGGAVLVIAFLFRLYRAFRSFFRHPLLMVSAFAADVLLLRVLQYWCKWPGVLYGTPVFGPGYYYSSWLLPSLGDVLLDALLLLVVSYFFFQEWQPRPSRSTGKGSVRLLVSASAVAFCLAVWILALWGTRTLTVNSSIPMNLQNISGLRLISAPAFLSIALLFGAVYFITARLAVFISQVIQPNRTEPVRPGFTWVLAHIILSSVLVTIVLNSSNRQVEHEKRKILAMRLATHRNPVTEVMFAQVQARMVSDSATLTGLVQQLDSLPGDEGDNLSQTLAGRYFQGYWAGFSLQVTLCREGEMLRIQPRGFLAPCDQYFDGIISELGQPTSVPGLYYLDYGYGNENYMAFIPLAGGYGRLVLEFSAKAAFKDLGYPELLIDKSQSGMQDLTGYSYASYKGGQLIQRVGAYPYGFYLSNYGVRSDTTLFFTGGGMNHLLYAAGNGNVLMISRPELSLFTEISPFSYLFILFSVFAFLFLAVVRTESLGALSLTTLRNRLQLSVLGIILSSFVIIGVVLMNFLVRLNTEKDKENLLERALSILVEMQHKFGAVSDLGPDSNGELANSLVKYSNVFFSDINVYSPEGMLLASSRPQIFEKGLVSGLMNPEALDRLRNGSLSMVVQTEEIGRHEYYSAYTPIYNDRNQLLCYLNLPYFSRQSDLRQEISAFLVAFVNIYVLFILLGLFAAFIIAGYITSPLKMLASRIGMTRLGDLDRKIFWRRNDEIGRLVNEYNRMLDQLAESAERLALSERETAWREMARQVAHEIKNPLTPMKLSIQHLQRAWDDRAPDWDQRLKRFTTSMTEQIDALARISSEFSDFAKMPEPVNEPLDLADLITSALPLYRNIAGIQVRFDPPQERCWVLSDRRQLIRVFNNLLNNAIQAIGHDRGEVVISLGTLEGMQVIRVRDTGPGIPPEQAERIFQPNFTTKSGGTGLGLAIVSEIIRSQRGQISFESEPGKGTTFVITLPVYHPTDERSS